MSLPTEPAPREQSGRFFLKAGALQGIAEAFSIALVLGLSVYIATDDVLAGTSVLQVLVIGPLSGMYAAARIRLREDGLSGSLVPEILIALGLIIPVTLFTAPAAVSGTRAPGVPELVFFTVFLFFWNMGAFAFFRVLAYFWPTWVRLRRSRLRWEMTHATLMVVAPVAALVLVLLVLTVVTGSQFAFIDGNVSLLGRFVAILPAIGIVIFLTVVGLAFLLPPAALISYFAARNTAARLEALSEGTSALSEGNLATRVVVDGEDEVSEVQRDFNLMADNLERLIEDLRTERDNVERLLNEQRELVASVSHELRTPVATMRGYLESALNNPDDRSPQELTREMEIMAREVERLQRLIDDLFVLSRADAGKLPLTIEPVNVAALIGHTVAAVAGNAWRTGRVEVVEDVVPGLPRALGDPNRLEQVLRNLLTNAVRHTPPGGIVAVTAYADDGMLAIEVRDTGEGIAPEHLDAIFERFHRLDEARQRDPQGAGLGLALVKELTEAMGGRVSATSEPGLGSTFTIHLPLA